MGDIFDNRRCFDQEAYDRFIAQRRAREEKEAAQHQAMLKRERAALEVRERDRREAALRKQVADLKVDVEALKAAKKVPKRAKTEL